MLLRVVWYKRTDVSEDSAISLNSSVK